MKYLAIGHYPTYRVAGKEKIAAAEESHVQAAAKVAQEPSPPQAQNLSVNEQLGAPAQVSTAATASNCESVRS